MPRKVKTEEEVKKEKQAKADKKKDKPKTEHDQTIPEGDEPCENVSAAKAEDNEFDGFKADDEELQAKYVRLAADFQNFRRRTENEKRDIYAYANENIVKELLTVIDNFERAMDQAKESSDKALADGVVLIYKQLKEVLEKFGTAEIPALGEPFDPNLHHAVMMDSESNEESGKVTEVFQKGYTLNGRVVRPSMVKVTQ